jgi:hypothetical protein
MKSTMGIRGRMMNWRLEPGEDESFKVLAPLEVPVLDQLCELIIFLELQRIPRPRVSSHGESTHEERLQ